MLVGDGFLGGCATVSGTQTKRTVLLDVNTHVHILLYIIFHILNISRVREESRGREREREGGKMGPIMGLRCYTHYFGCVLE